MPLITVSLPKIYLEPIHSSGETLREALNGLLIIYPQLQPRFFNPNGRPRRYLPIYVNGEVFGTSTRELNTRVGPDDWINVGLLSDPEIRGRLPDSASLTITLATPEHTVTDVAWLVGAIDNLVMAGIWGALAQPEPSDETLQWAGEVLTREVSESTKAPGRFFPRFFLGPRERGFAWTPPNYNSFDSLDVGMQSGMNVFLRRALDDDNHERYERLFSFARVRRLEQHSPTLFEILAILGTAPALPAVLVYGCMKAVSMAQRDEFETGIRGTELELKQEELKQAKMRTEAQRHITDAIINTPFSNTPREVPETVIAETARIAATTVADLSSSPLVGSISFGLTRGK
jgi:hypothetical protein